MAENPAEGTKEHAEDQEDGKKKKPRRWNPFARSSDPTDENNQEKRKQSIDSTGSGAGSANQSADDGNRKNSTVAQPIAVVSGEGVGSGVEDDPDLYEYDEFGNVIKKKSDPAMVAKRQQAELKRNLAAGAETAIRKAATKLSHRQNRACEGIFIISGILAIIGAIHIYVLNQPLGPPPTREAATAAKSLLAALLFHAVISIAAFVILYLRFSQLIIAFAWLLLLSYLEYLTSINVAKSAEAVHTATFEDIKLYSKDHFDTFLSIPDYVAHFEIIGNCCGWGNPDKKFQSWPKLLDSEHFPDSCCKNRFHGCGNGAVQRSVASGYVMQLSTKEYAQLLQSNRGQIDTTLWFNTDDPLSKVLGYFPPQNGFPDELLRLVDEVYDSPLFFYMGEDFDTTKNQTVAYVYKSYGQAENGRLSATIKEATCDTTLLVRTMWWHTLVVLIYSSIQMLICLIMAVVFWYYFIELRADYLARQPPAGEFTLLKMERICIDDRYNAILREKKRMDVVQNVKESQKKEEEEHNRLLEDAQDAIELEEGEAAKEKSMKAPKIIAKHTAKVEPMK